MMLTSSMVYFAGIADPVRCFLLFAFCGFLQYGDRGSVFYFQRRYPAKDCHQGRRYCHGGYDALRVSRGDHAIDENGRGNVRPAGRRVIGGRAKAAC